MWKRGKISCGWNDDEKDMDKGSKQTCDEMLLPKLLPLLSAEK